MKKLTNTEAELKKSVANKKKAWYFFSLVQFFENFLENYPFCRKSGNHANSRVRGLGVSCSLRHYDAMRTKIENCLLTTSIWQGTEKYVDYSSWSSWRQRSSFCFGIGSPSIFLCVAVTIIWKRFLKLGIIVYYAEYSRKHEVKMTHQA